MCIVTNRYQTILDKPGECFISIPLPYFITLGTFIGYSTVSCSTVCCKTSDRILVIVLIPHCKATSASTYGCANNSP